LRKQTKEDITQFLNDNFNGDYYDDNNKQFIDTFNNNIQNYIKLLKKGKAVPLQAWSGPEGSRKLRFPDFMTTAQDGGKLVSLKHRPPLPLGNTPGTHFC
jgi:hypothetical protein